MVLPAVAKRGENASVIRAVGNRCGNGDESRLGDNYAQPVIVPSLMARKVADQPLMSPISRASSATHASLVPLESARKAAREDAHH